LIVAIQPLSNQIVGIDCCKAAIIQSEIYFKRERPITGFTSINWIFSKRYTWFNIICKKLSVT